MISQNAPPQLTQESDSHLMIYWRTTKTVLKQISGFYRLWSYWQLFRQEYLISNKAYVSRQYESRLGKKLNLKHPQTFNEKIQWLKLHWRDKKAVLCADKYAVRSFVETRIDKKHLIELYGVYSRVDEIDLSSLPQAFVLKATHGSGWNYLCRNQSDCCWEEVFARFKKWLGSNYYDCGREWVYRDIPPRIVCERFLFMDNGEPPWDYKLFCFSGKPTFVQVDVDRFTEHRRNMYDVNWNRAPFSLEYPPADYEVPRPKNLEKMLAIATSLSQGFPFVRVDLYDLESEVYFGEMTFYPGNGTEHFEPTDYDARLGELLKLPKG